MPIYPTNTCFDDSMELLEYSTTPNNDKINPNTLLLVHGIMISVTNVEYSHGWIEDDGYCWDAGIVLDEKIYYRTPMLLYYEKRKVKETTKYTLEEALAENLKYETFGPWVQKYRDLCGGVKMFVLKDAI